MSFTPYIPDTKQWTEYFINQASVGKNNKQSARKVIDPTLQIGGGLTINNGSYQLTKVGKVKDKVPNNNGSVKVQLVSPSESTLEQAESELSHIKEVTKSFKNTSSKAVKRKASSTKKGPKGKKKKTSAHKDVFS